MGFVYVMECVAPDTKTYCKIGITEHDLDQRRKSIQTGCPFEINRTWVSRNIPDYKLCESAIHHELKDYRTNGEWFSTPFAKACCVADRICKVGFQENAERIISQLKADQAHIKKRLEEIDGELDFLQYDIKNYVRI